MDDEPDLAAPVVDDPAAVGWEVDKAGAHYIKNPTGPGVLRRRDGETVQECIGRQEARTADRPADDPARDRPKRGRRRGRPDPKPRIRTQTHAGASEVPSDHDLQAMLEGVLAAPAIPALVILHCEFCATHFAQQAGPTARQLVVLAKDNPGLRRTLLQLHAAWTKITYGGVIAAYVGKPVLHHMAPEQIVENVGPFLGVPPRTPAQEAAHQHQHANGSPTYARPAPNANTPPPNPPPGPAAPAAE